MGGLFQLLRRVYEFSVKNQVLSGQANKRHVPDKGVVRFGIREKF